MKKKRDEQPCTLWLGFIRELCRWLSQNPTLWIPHRDICACGLNRVGCVAWKQHGWQQGDITTSFNTWRSGGQENIFLSLSAVCRVDPLWRTRFEVFLCAAICWLEAAIYRVSNWIWATSVYIHVFPMKLVFPPLWMWLHVSRELQQYLICLHFFCPNRALNDLQRHLLFKQNIKNTPKISSCTIIFCKKNFKNFILPDPSGIRNNIKEKEALQKKITHQKCVTTDKSSCEHLFY